MLTPRPAGSKGKTKPVRVDEASLTLVRMSLVEQLEPRLRKLPKPEGGYKHADPNFVYFFGPDLEKLTDAAIISHALQHLWHHIRETPDGVPRPIGECGIPAVDDVTPGDHLGEKRDDAD